MKKRIIIKTTLSNPTLDVVTIMKLVRQKFEETEIKYVAKTELKQIMNYIQYLKDSKNDLFKK